MDEPGHRGEHAPLDQDHEQQTLDSIRQNAEQDIPVMEGEIMDYCATQFHIKFTRGWANSFILQYSDYVIHMKSTAQEGQRLQVPRAFLEETVQNLNNHVQGCIPELVFNLDEVGISYWEDGNTKTGVVPTAQFGRTIHHGVSRNFKNISVIACDLATGKSLIHSTITPQFPHQFKGTLTGIVFVSGES
jgi:hypothetical protein